MEYERYQRILYVLRRDVLDILKEKRKPDSVDPSVTIHKMASDIIRSESKLGAILLKVEYSEEKNKFDFTFG